MSRKTLIFLRVLNLSCLKWRSSFEERKKILEKNGNDICRNLLWYLLCTCSWILVHSITIQDWCCTAFFWHQTRPICILCGTEHIMMKFRPMLLLFASVYVLIYKQKVAVGLWEFHHCCLSCLAKTITSLYQIHLYRNFLLNYSLKLFTYRSLYEYLNAYSLMFAMYIRVL
jgi:hypothetical protein